jgi:hypothetical protein
MPTVWGVLQEGPKRSYRGSFVSAMDANCVGSASGGSEAFVPRLLRLYVGSPEIDVFDLG